MIYGSKMQCALFGTGQKYGGAQNPLLCQRLLLLLKYLDRSNTIFTRSDVALN